MISSDPIPQPPSLRDYKMASSGDSIYFVWLVQNPGHGMSLFFEKSPDGGRTLGSKVLLANSTRIDNPVIAAYGNSVYVAWDHQENQPEIMMRRSIDSGTTFQDPVTIGTGDASQHTFQAITAHGRDVSLIWTGIFGPNRTQSVMVSQSSDGGAKFGDPVTLSDASLQSNEQAVVQSDSTTYVVWNSKQNCPDPLGNCKSMIFLRPISDGRIGATVHLESLDGIFPIEAVADSDTVLVEGLKRAFDNAVFENSTIIMMQSHDRGSTFSATSSTYKTYMAGIFPVLADSTLYQFWTVYEMGLGPEPIYVERSLDGGRTFGTPEKISGSTTPLGVQLDQQTAPYKDSAYVVWSGTDKAGAYHVFLDKIGPDSHSNIRMIEDLGQAGGFHILSGSQELYLSFFAGQNIFFESVGDKGYAETGLLCPVNPDLHSGSILLDKPQTMIDGMPSHSVLTKWDVALSSEMHMVHDETGKVIYQVQAIKGGSVTFQSSENYTVTCGYSPSDIIDWYPQSAGNYTIVASILNPSNMTDIISSGNQTVQVYENMYLGNFSATAPAQFKIVNESASVDRGGWAKFAVKAGPSSPNYRLHNIELWIDSPQGVVGWFDKYSIFSYDYRLDNLTMYVYSGSASVPGTNQLKIEGKGFAANLLNGSVFAIGNPMPPAGNQQFPFDFTSLHENGQQVGTLNITINSHGRQQTYTTIGPPNHHPIMTCTKEPIVNGNGGGSNCIGFIGYEDFPVTVYSDSPRTVDLGATNLPDGTWTRFLPQQVTATSGGTPSRLVMAGAIEPYEINVLSVKVGRIYANTTQGSSVAYLPLVGNEKIHVLGGSGPIEFGSAGVNINHTTPSMFGMVYDSTSGSLPVSLSVLGISKNNTTVPLPPWLTVNLVPSSFTLNYSQPFYMKMETGTMSPPPGANVTVLVGEQVGGSRYTGHLQVTVPPAVYYRAMMSPVETGADVPSNKHTPVQSVSSSAKIQLQCRTGLVSLSNVADGRLACVKSGTAKALVERGWASEIAATKQSSQDQGSRPVIDKMHS